MDFDDEGESRERDMERSSTGRLVQKGESIQESDRESRKRKKKRI